MKYFDIDWMTIELILVLVISHGLCLFLGYFFANVKARNEPVKFKEDSKLARLPECKRRCDPNQCDTWCKAKERFTRDH